MIEYILFVIFICLLIMLLAALTIGIIVKIGEEILKEHDEDDGLDYW